MPRFTTRWGRGRVVLILTLALTAGLLGLAAAGVLTKVVAWPGRAADPLAPGFAAYDRADWDLAFRVARGRLGVDPDDPVALRLLARTSGRLGRDDSARALFNRVGPGAWGAEDRFVLGLVIWRAREPDVAADSFELALAADPGHAEALHALAVLARKKSSPLAAAGLAERLALRPGWGAVGFSLLGEIRDDLADFAAAERAYRRALAGPEAGGMNVAAADAREFVRLNPPPDRAGLHTRLARDLLRLGRASEAGAELASAAAASGGAADPERDWLRGRVMLQEGGRVDPALAAAARAYRAAHPVEPEPAPYVGSAACAGCHSALSQAQQKGHHARSFARAGEPALADLPLPPPDTADPADPRARHTLSRSAAGDRLTFETKLGDTVYRAVVAYAFGSGDRGLSLVGRDAGGQDRELRLSRYADVGASRAGWDLTTGHSARPGVGDGYLGRPLTADAARGCLLCHTTEPRAAAEPSSPTFADRGIGCETCHGPGGHHERAVETDQPDPAIAAGKGRAPAAAVNGQCGRCHGTTDAAYSPEAPASVRFQANSLAASRCWSESGEARSLSCVACHDPHRDAGTAAAPYEAVCLSCHGGPAGSGPGSIPQAKTVCPVNRAADCLKCHMPVVTTPSIPHSPFTDHRIRVRKALTGAR